MKAFLTLLIAGAAVSGCATAPANPWTDTTTEQEAAARPLHCGGFPLPAVLSDSGATYDKDGVNALERYRQCSEANEAIGNEHAEQIGDLKRSRAALVGAGRAQRNVADMRQTMLEDERQHHFWQSIGYWIVIIALAL